MKKLFLSMAIVAMAGAAASAQVVKKHKPAQQDTTYQQHQKWQKDTSTHRTDTTAVQRLK